MCMGTNLPCSQIVGGREYRTLKPQKALAPFDHVHLPLELELLTQDYAHFVFRARLRKTLSA